ncbi:MAG TPA: glycine--tRNA ligase subunit beta, partial [Candidatus Saccharimonadales bacterium]|nr:glycine--tRNA ligase subunit beta [Candidatus Saccharimonadales bacterium]
MTERGETGTFLLEVGCEEIPAPMIPGALEDLASGLAEALGPLAAGAETFTGFGGPRRLTALLRKVLRREEDREEIVHGPPRSAAFDAGGRPTKAAEGFARKHGVAVNDLAIVTTPKGEVVAARRHVEGRTAAGILSGAVPEVLRRMRFRKTMRWGDQGFLFVRPVHWILALFDGEVVPFEFMGARSGRTTLGHRFLGPGPHEIPDAGSYEEILSAKGAVVARHAERRKRILEAANRAASEAGGRLRSDEALVDELTFLTEHPAIIAGAFPEVFLELPEPVLMTAMRHHQKYLTIEGPDGRLRNAFVGVLGTEPDAEGLIRRGNEWVLKARLADARFFFREDQKLPLADRVPALSGVTFHAHLGSYADKSGRLGSLVDLLARATGTEKTESAALMDAARLCKTDLTTGMVGEFPELQGVVGGIYARMQGHDEICARAIEEHYRPSGAGEPIPSPGAPSLLALADKIDTLAVCFSAGLIPKGSADPYALRRAALGVLRILIENGMRLDLGPVLQAALAAAAGARGAAPP